VLEGRQQSEEAYLSSLQELQEAILSQSATIQDDIKDRMAQVGVEFKCMTHSYRYIGIILRGSKIVFLIHTISFP